MTTIMVEHNSFVEGHRERVSLPREANGGFQGDNTFTTLDALGTEVPTKKSNDLWITQRASVDDEFTTPELLDMSARARAEGCAPPTPTARAVSTAARPVAARHPRA
jgi:hypothetical protein